MQPSARRSIGVSSRAHTAVFTHSGWHPHRRATSDFTAPSACWLSSHATRKLSSCFGCDRRRMAAMTIQTLRLQPIETEEFRRILPSIWTALLQRPSNMGPESSPVGSCRPSSSMRIGKSSSLHWLTEPCWRKKRDSNRCCLSLNALLMHKRGAIGWCTSVSY